MTALERIRLRFEKIRHRKVIQWALAYLAGAWVILQVLDVLAETFQWPVAAERNATVLLGVGFLGALVLAWYHGDEGRQRMAGMEVLLLGAVLMLASGGIWWSRTYPGDEAGLMAVAVPGVAVAPSVVAKSVAVLPFEILSDDRSDAYFADGIHEDLLTQLARVRGIRVISRTSVLGYRDSERTMREIGRELGVGMVLEASVRRAGNRIRLTAQLIDARSDRHLWAESYDRELADVFAIQSELAQAIAAALEAQLTTGELVGMDRSLTTSPDAYDLYLQARDYRKRPGWRAENMAAAERLYERAIALDSGFAIAHARLSHLHSQTYWYGHDRTADRLEKARASLDTARRLGGDLPDVHMAAGYYHYWGWNDGDAALEEFAAAERILPGDADVRLAIAYVQRRQGRAAEALRTLESVAAIDPRNADLFFNLGISYISLRRYPAAARALERAQALAPDLHLAVLQKGYLYVFWKGELDSLRAAIDRVPPEFEPSAGGGPQPIRFHLALMERDYSRAVRIAESLPDVLDHMRQFLPRPLLTAMALDAAGDHVRARMHYDSACAILETALRDRPDDPRIRSALARAYAGVDRKLEAVEQARRATELLAVSRDVMGGRHYLLELAEVHARVGEPDEAVRVLEQLISVSGRPSAHELRLHPRWDPLRGHPKFRRLITL